MEFLSLLVPLLVIAALLLIAWRSRRRAAESDARMRRDITVGTHVMTTSGLYGTVVAMNSDDTVILAVAPGVEVRWAFAALRDATALPPRYRRAATAETASSGTATRPDRPARTT
ncbi:MAG: preprotein translocase subunit YajC [bacterium]